MPAPSKDTTGAWRARAHRTAKHFNWDYGFDKLREIIRQQCDLGTAMLIYWAGQPDFYRRFKSRAEITGNGRDHFDMLVEIERNVAAGFYTHQNIPFNPFDDEGENWCENCKRNVHCELPEAMYRGAGTHEQMAQRKPLRSDIPSLPIGLSALAEVEPIPKTDTDKAIAYLNSLNDNSYRDVVEKTGNIVTTVSFFSNWKATDDALQHLKWFPDVTELQLGQKMTDEALEHLHFVTKLRKLTLVKLMTDKGLVNLAQVPMIEELSLHGCGKITDAGLEHVGKLKQLRHLDLGATKIGDAGLAYLSEMTNLEHLELYYYTKITNAG
ncbi:MAG: DUF4274 domain-containing protein, partial [Planctomycetes bacterium]|nr:DUF4274 domain-containing protein [Planctomycetota bacterium]